jgi:hypothetical protein
MKKRFHHNGKYVCDYDSTGEPLKDIPIIHRLMAEHGVATTDVSPEQMIFRQANSFIATSAYLFEKDICATPPNAMAVAPFVVNAAFALELYLKTIALQRGKKLHGHELVRLFDKLPASGKVAIERQLEIVAPVSQWQCEARTLADLRSIVLDLNNAFVEWRYLHEKMGTLRQITFRPMIFLGEVLHETCQAGFASGIA